MTKRLNKTKAKKKKTNIVTRISFWRLFIRVFALFLCSYNCWVSLSSKRVNGVVIFVTVLATLKFNRIGPQKN